MRRPAAAAWLLAAAFGLLACAVNPDRLPRTYLLETQQAVAAHDAPKALAALDRAETLWVSGNSPFSGPFLQFDPQALRDMGNARAAIRMGNWSAAAYWVTDALAQPTVVTPG